MKNSLPYILVLAIIFIVYQFLNPKVITETKTEYIKGDTVTVIKKEIVEVVIKDTKVKTDSFYVTDSTVFIPFTDFKIGNDSVNTAGQVAFFDSSFSFKDVSIKYPEKIITKTAVDTLLKTTTIQQIKPFYTDHWFWSTIGLLIIAILQIT